LTKFKSGPDEIQVVALLEIPRPQDRNTIMGPDDGEIVAPSGDLRERERKVNIEQTNESKRPRYLEGRSKESDHLYEDNNHYRRRHENDLHYPRRSTEMADR